MKLSARIDPRLRWFLPKDNYVMASLTEPTLKLYRGPAYDVVDPLAALRAFTYKVKSRTSALEFVREHGPLIEPVDGKVSVSDMVKTQRALVAVWKAWQELDAKTLAQWRRMRRGHLKELAEQGDPDPDYQPQVATADDFAIVDPGAVQSMPKDERLVFFSDEVLDEPNLLKARQRHVAPLFAKAQLNTRLEFDGAGLVLRPNDLQSAMWLALAQKIALGDASILCRYAGCGNYASRWSTNGDSMRAVYCDEHRKSGKCSHRVEREWKKGNKEADRYPQLRGLNATKFLKAAHKLRGEEVL